MSYPSIHPSIYLLVLDFENELLELNEEDEEEDERLGGGGGGGLNNTKKKGVKSFCIDDILSHKEHAQVNFDSLLFLDFL